MICVVLVFFPGSFRQLSRNLQNYNFSFQLSFRTAIFAGCRLKMALLIVHALFVYTPISARVTRLTRKDNSPVLFSASVNSRQALPRSIVSIPHSISASTSQGLTSTLNSCLQLYCLCIVCIHMLGTCILDCHFYHLRTHSHTRRVAISNTSVMHKCEYCKLYIAHSLIIMYKSTVSQNNYNVPTILFAGERVALIVW